MKFKTPKPTARMELLVSLGREGLPFWDICCDHGYIGILALKSQRYTSVYFVDNVEHIIDRLAKLIKISPLDFPKDQAVLIHSPAEDLSLKLFGTVVIAGVGGRTIIKILKSLLLKNLLCAEVVLLSAHTDEALLSEFIMDSSMSKQYITDGVCEIKEGRRGRRIIKLLKVSEQA